MNNEIAVFQEVVWNYYAKHGRHDLPWRQPDTSGVFDAYAIAVSEMMLQQTQVNRVIAKYTTFLQLFPTVHSLAEAELGDVLRAWQGLGYNRRAKYLWQAAQVVIRDYGGLYPRTLSELVLLPGIGANTAGAICAYAYDMPIVFIETNIRTVMIHHFFADQSDISDAQIREKVHETLPTDKLDVRKTSAQNELALGKPKVILYDGEVAVATSTAEKLLMADQNKSDEAGILHTSSTSPREWYWALMDYGTYRKQTTGNLNKLSKSYTKQSTFQGSRRQVRGAILRMLSNGAATKKQLELELQDDRVAAVLDDLTAEQLISVSGSRYHL